APRRTRTDNPLIKSQVNMLSLNRFSAGICGDIPLFAVFQRSLGFPAFFDAFPGILCTCRAGYADGIGSGIGSPPVTPGAGLPKVWRDLAISTRSIARSVGGVACPGDLPKSRSFIS